MVNYHFSLLKVQSITSWRFIITYDVTGAVVICIMLATVTVLELFSELLQLLQFYLKVEMKHNTDNNTPTLAMCNAYELIMQCVLQVCYNLFISNAFETYK